MTNIIDAAETAASPYLFWAKLAGIVVIVGAIAFGGWYVRGRFDQPKIDQAQLATEQCRTAGEIARANANATAAAAAQSSITLADQADTEAAAELGKIKTQSISIMEKVDAAPNGQSLGSDPALSAYLDGLRNAAATAGN